MSTHPDTTITSIEELEALYDRPGEAATIKEVDFLTGPYRAFLEAAPFVTLATVGPEGADCSPRGDSHGLVKIIDERTIAIPDRRGNNRIDSLRNIVRDPRVALLFLVPGVNETLRINGRAVLSTDTELLATLEAEGKRPKCAIVVTIEAAYLQCARALMRSALWDPARFVERKSLPTVGEALQAVKTEFDGAAYDAAWPARAKASLY